MDVWQWCLTVDASDTTFGPCEPYDLWWPSCSLWLWWRKSGLKMRGDVWKRKLCTLWHGNGEQVVGTTLPDMMKIREMWIITWSLEPYYGGERLAIRPLRQVYGFVEVPCLLEAIEQRDCSKWRYGMYQALRWISSPILHVLWILLCMMEGVRFGPETEDESNQFGMMDDCHVFTPQVKTMFDSSSCMMEGLLEMMDNKETLRRMLHWWLICLPSAKPRIKQGAKKSNSSCG